MYLMFLIIYYSICMYLFIPLYSFHLSSFLCFPWRGRDQSRSPHHFWRLGLRWRIHADRLCAARDLHLGRDLSDALRWKRPGSHPLVLAQARIQPGFSQDSSRIHQDGLGGKVNVEDFPAFWRYTSSVFWVDHMWIITLSHIVSYCHIPEITYGHARCSVAF